MSATRRAAAAAVPHEWSALDELAEEIVARLEQRLGPRLAQTVAADATTRPSDPPGAKWSARRVAAHYGVTVGFVYDHADELGCVRLGSGQRARLRFDPGVVRERWASIGDDMPDVTRQRRAERKRPGGPSRRSRRTTGFVPLEYDPEQ